MEQKVGVKFPPQALQRHQESKEHFRETEEQQFYHMLNLGRQEGIDPQKLFGIVKLWKNGTVARPTVLKQLAILIRSKNRGPSIQGLEV